jgi:hypothetical protein
MAITGLEMIRNKELRIWGLASLAAVTIKSAYELWAGQVFLEFMHMGLCGNPVAASHAGGVIGGVTIFALIWYWDKGHRKVEGLKRRKV